jgi:hypothetical protein
MFLCNVRITNMAMVRFFEDVSTTRQLETLSSEICYVLLEIH